MSSFSESVWSKETFLPASELVELSSYFRESDMSINMLDSVELLKFSREVPVHNFHLFL